MDSVDNSVTVRPNGASKTDKSGSDPTRRGESAVTARGQNTDGDDNQLRGSDLARAALQAAKDAAATRNPTGRRSLTRRGGAAGGSRLRRRWSGAGADDRDPQPLGRIVSRISADRGWHDQLAGGQVFGRWAQLVGDEVAEHAKPVTLKDGELTVQASSTAWATQLRLLQRQLLVKIAAGVGHGVVKRLKVSGPVAPSWRKGPRTVPGRGPRDTYG